MHLEGLTYLWLTYLWLPEMIAKATHPIHTSTTLHPKIL